MRQRSVFMQHARFVPRHQCASRNRIQTDWQGHGHDGRAAGEAGPAFDSVAVPALPHRTAVVGGNTLFGDDQEAVQNMTFVVKEGVATLNRNIARLQQLVARDASTAHSKAASARARLRPPAQLTCPGLRRQHRGVTAEPAGCHVAPLQVGAGGAAVHRAAHPSPYPQLRTKFMKDARERRSLYHDSAATFSQPGCLRPARPLT